MPEMLEVWLPLAFRSFVAAAAAIWTQDAMAHSENRWRTATKAIGVGLAIAAVAAFRAGCEPDPYCDPDPLRGGCSSICDVVTWGDRMAGASRSAGVVLAGILSGLLLTSWRTVTPPRDPEPFGLPRSR